MDLVYMNSSKEDVGVLKDYTMDLAYGSDENNFECKIDSDDHCCDAGYFLYFEDTEYGGIVDEIEVNTEAQEVTYLGRTWHGILNSKILEPDADQDYLICNGEANEVIDALISRMGLNAFFSASNEDSGINISSYKMNRYIGGYEGIKKMLKSVGAKLIIKFADGYAVLSAEAIVDYSEIREMTDDTMNFTIKKNFMPINHVVCLGSGDLKDRRVIHLFCDANGNISGTQSFTGINEMTAVYDYPNAESDEELIKGGVDIIAESRQSLQVDFSFASDDESIDIGDKISATERISAIAITVAIAKKIVNIHNGLTDIAYECEGFTGSVASSGYPSSGGGGTENIDAINVIFDNAGTTYTSENVQDALEEIDTKKLSLTGGTVTGIISRNKGGQWISDRDNVAVEGISHGQPSGNSYNPVVGQKTTAGHWSIGNLSGEENLIFNYTKDTDYPNNNVGNPARLKKPLASGQTIAYLGDCAKSPYGIDLSDQSSGYVMFTINSYTPWMLSFECVVYQNYANYHFRVSGYNYNTTGKWYTPLAHKICGTSTTVYFGHTSNNHLYVAIPKSSYVGAGVFNIVNGYQSIESDSSWDKLITISTVSSLPGTIDAQVSI